MPFSPENVVLVSGYCKAYEPIEPVYGDAERKLAKADDFESALKLPAFDSWRDLQTPELTNAIIAARKLIREKGVKAALPAS